MMAQCGRAIAVKRRADGFGQADKIYVLGVQNAVAVLKMIHRFVPIGLAYSDWAGGRTKFPRLPHAESGAANNRAASSSKFIILITRPRFPLQPV